MSWKRRWNQLRNLTNINTIQLNTSFADGNAEGRLQWNSEDGTLEYGLPGGNVNLQVGQEHVVKVFNNSGGDIKNGHVCRVTGATGSRITIGLAKADSVTTSAGTSMATEDIDDNSFGYVTTAGLVRDIDTDGLGEGNLVYLSATEAGALQNTMPTAPNRKTIIGYCLKDHAEEGIMGIRPVVVFGLLTASDVLLGVPNDGDILVWVAANGRFELQQP